MPAPEYDETRAEIARRRLADLAASFNASLPESHAADNDEEPDDAELRLGRAHAGRWGITKKHVRFVVMVGVIALAAVGWWLFSGGQGIESSGAEPMQVAHDSTATREGEASGKQPDTLIVHVVGRVKNPGIVTVPAGARVADAIEAAGGAKGKVNFAELNLARTLEDGEQIRVGLSPAFEPTSASGVAGSGQTESPDGAPRKVNLNSASATELETLPGVGPVTAQSIIDWRAANQRFGSVEDLLDIRGIGEATLERLRPLVTV